VGHYVDAGAGDGVRTLGDMTTRRSRASGHQIGVLPFQGGLNLFARGLLHVPVLWRLPGRRLVTLYVRGRTSGRVFAVPMTYARHHDDLLLGTRFAWGKNLRSGEPIEIRYRGRRRRAEVRVVIDEAGVVDRYGVIARQNPYFARYNQIRLDAHGEPDPRDLRAAWADGARVVVLTPR
jgi:hypothetical protein